MLDKFLQRALEIQRDIKSVDKMVALLEGKLLTERQRDIEDDGGKLVDAGQVDELERLLEAIKKVRADLVAEFDAL